MWQQDSVHVSLRARARTGMRRSLHRIGALDLWRRRKARSRLTVVMLHRIVSDRASATPENDPHHSLCESLFEASLAALSRQYTVISLPHLLAWIDGAEELPDRPLLLTFDDGWADTSDLALPALRRAGLPAAVFVATDAVADHHPVWWQEACRLDGSAPEGSLDRVRALAQDRSAREALLARRLTERPMPVRQMLRPEDLASLWRSQMAIGSHSAGHLPLTDLTDEEIADDLGRSRRALAQWLGDEPQAKKTALRCLAFPHGRWDDRVLSHARAAGFDVFFGSEPCLNSLAGLPALPFGRISLTTAVVAGRDGRFAPDRLASWLLARSTLSTPRRP
jgi:peptidoglycan/xylan/chitin deacetylase (PgdA/CDA1 family)